MSSIYAYPPAGPFEVIVVDNASSDGSAAMVKEQFPDTTLIEHTSNSGYAKGNNLGFAVATGEYILTLNPDTEMEPSSLGTAMSILGDHPECAAVSVKFIGPDGEVQSSIRRFPTLANVFGAWSGLARLFPRSPFGGYFAKDFDYSKSGPCDQPMGTFLLFRRSTLSEIGDVQAPFDLQFPIYFNEVDLLKRLADKGYSCWYTCETSIRHHHGASTRQVKKAMIWESHKSLIRYWRKHLAGSARIFLPFAMLASYSIAFIRAKSYHAGFRPEHHNL